MIRFENVAVAAVVVFVGAACARQPPAPSEGNKVAPTASTAALAMVIEAGAGEAGASEAGADASVDAFAFRTVTNIEMVPYCLPYPSAYLEEDTSERWEHGRKVFTARTRTKDVRPSQMDLSGTCGPRSLKELFEADKKDIESRSPGATITVSRLERESYALSWRVGDRIHYGKMWSARGDAGCFVRATFDYDLRERRAFDTIIARVVSADPVCPPR